MSETLNPFTMDLVGYCLSRAVPVVGTVATSGSFRSRCDFIAAAVVGTYYCSTIVAWLTLNNLNAWWKLKRLGRQSLDHSGAWHGPSDELINFSMHRCITSLQCRLQMLIPLILSLWCSSLVVQQEYRISRYLAQMYDNRLKSILPPPSGGGHPRLRRHGRRWDEVEVVDTWVPLANSMSQSQSTCHVGRNRFPNHRRSRFAPVFKIEETLYPVLRLRVRFQSGARYEGEITDLFHDNLSWCPCKGPCANGFQCAYCFRASFMDLQWIKQFKVYPFWTWYNRKQITSFFLFW